MRDNKGERGRDVREDRGRDDRWRDCVKGGFCLINCFSGARECQTFWMSPGAVLRHCRVYDACRRAYSPPLLGIVLCLRASSLPSRRQTSLAAASYWPLSESSPQRGGAILHPQDVVLTNSAVALARSLPTPWVFGPFYGTRCKSISPGNDGDDSKQPARYTWVKLHSDYPLITNIINLEKTSAICERFVSNGNFILCAHQGLCWGRVWSAQRW